jgi:Universal stress protein family
MPDLVVIGTQGRSGVAKMLLGSVAEKVLRSFNIDILAVPPARRGPVIATEFLGWRDFNQVDDTSHGFHGDHEGQAVTGSVQFRCANDFSHDRS